MVSINKGERVVVIIGLPGCGKTTLSKELEKRYPSYKVIHTDQYSQLGGYGSEDALAALWRDVEKVKTGLIIDGCLCYRLLRSGAEMNLFRPDLIIHVCAQSATRERRRKDKDYSQMDLIYRKIWRDYISIEHNMPRFVEIDTTNSYGT